ncbi:MAG: FRG domain-containing protein [Spirochaetaceae bacterium]|nr:FRG domain-containing protein [Spirochaetaceae bacterium]
MMIIETIKDYEKLRTKNACGQYVFRGHADKDWDLLPTAYRCGSNIECPWYEKEPVSRFIQHLQENGYRDFPSELNQVDFLTKATAVFPAEELLPYLALAQHYAFDSQFHWIKTSLLDVTHNLDIAACFAVEDETKWTIDGKFFVFDTSAMKEPYRFYEPLGGSRLEARLVVQDAAFIYRQQTVEHKDDHLPYKNREPFDDTVKDTIIIPGTLKPLLKEYLQKKLFELFLCPRLVLGQVKPNMATAGYRTYEELREIHRPAVERAEKLGNKHSDY